jgi:hypothetical protein
MNLPVEKALFILQLLCGGNGIRSIQRLTGCHSKPWTMTDRLAAAQSAGTA